MKRPLIIGSILAAAAIALVGAHAFARGPFMHGPDAWKQHMEKRLTAVLDEAKATPEQRTAVRAAIDHVIATASDTHQDRKAMMEQAAQLFEADKLDPQAIAQHRKQHEAAQQKIGDAVVQALYDVHDTLSPSQRKVVADFVRAHHDEEAKEHGGLKAELFKRMISSRIDDALDAANVTAAQRQTAHDARDRVFAAIEKVHTDRQGDLEQALAIFTADKIDAKAVAELRARHVAQMNATGDVIVGAITDLHDALDAGQRKALVEYIKTHHPRFEGHHG